MKTRTAPWDYSRNTPVIFDEELSAMNARKDELAALKAELTAIIGSRAYNQFEASLPVWIRTNTTEMIEELNHELDRYECYCNPRNEPCGACQRRYQTRGE